MYRAFKEQQNEAESGLDFAVPFYVGLYSHYGRAEAAQYNLVYVSFVEGTFTSGSRALRIRRSKDVSEKPYQQGLVCPVSDALGLVEYPRLKYRIVLE